MVYRLIESVVMVVGYGHIESVFELWFIDILRDSRVMVYRHNNCDPRIMVDRRIESVTITMGYRHIESVFELRLTDILRVLIELWLTDVLRGLI
jgi:hypothetical protein